VLSDKADAEGQAGITQVCAIMSRWPAKETMHERILGTADRLFYSQGHAEERGNTKSQASNKPKGLAESVISAEASTVSPHQPRHGSFHRIAPDRLGARSRTVVW
jgi:hypothetical protein